MRTIVVAALCLVTACSAATEITSPCFGSDALRGPDWVCGQASEAEWRCERNGQPVPGNLTYDECIGHGPFDEPAGDSWTLRATLFVCDGQHAACGHLVTGEPHAPCTWNNAGGMDVDQCAQIDGDSTEWTLVEASP